MLTSRQHDRLIIIVVLIAIIAIAVYMLTTNRRLRREILGSVTHTERQCNILKSDIDNANMRIAGVKAWTQSIEDKSVPLIEQVKELRERVAPPPSQPPSAPKKADPLPADFF